MKVEALTIPGLSLVTPVIHGDTRGYFVELFHSGALATQGINFTVSRHARSRSKGGVVRGLHFQWDPPLGKLVRVARGRAFVVAVDIRKNSPTLGRWEGRELTEDTKEAIYMPFGFASGFCTFEEITDVEYYLSDTYNPAGESNILWNDPEIGISWPVQTPILSPRDEKAQTFKEWLARPESELFVQP